ncbi:hypothetical protein [uncultured Maribacter sp.]|uniref:hypothetical protein n=1 Tax=uncultured Maribacter sp. TaxID=431308 RepID=UPI00261C219D|nr:hypothetical protein [uncultured Maribacter sp.]
MLVITSCKIANLSKEALTDIEQSEKIATQKLNEVISAQGFNVLKSKNTFEFTATDYWPGIIGNIAKIWPEKKTTIKFRHNFNTFDGTGLFLNGEKEGDLIGIQSWNYYEKSKDSEEIKKYEIEKKKKLAFGLVIYHYFLELPYRLYKAPIKRYYGQKTKKGISYDLVFASWLSEAPNPDYDQYIVWINTQTKLVDYCVYTLRENKNPITRKKYGSIAYQDYRNIDGFMVPFNMPVMLDNGVIKKDTTDKFFHQITIENFTLGRFDEKELYPISKVKKQIDTK